jgi:hypothetical protein
MRIEEKLKVDKTIKTIEETDEGTSEKFRTDMISTDEDKKLRFVLTSEDKPELETGDVVRLLITKEQKTLNEVVKK